jgi:hypothetical protein
MYRVRLGKPQGRWPLGRSKKWEENIRMDLGEIRVGSDVDGTNQFIVTSSGAFYYHTIVLLPMIEDTYTNGETLVSGGTLCMKKVT